MRLNAGPETWNAWREEYPEIRPDLRSADLSSMNMHAVDLDYADLTNAIVTDADLRRATLRNADLTGVKGIESASFGGTDLTGARVPRVLKARLASVLAVLRDASAAARVVFIGMLLGCAYAALAAFTMRDADLLTNAGAVPLPLLRTEVPINVFYIAAPWLLVAVFVYFHLYVRAVCRRLATVPAVLPDGTDLQDAVDPWIVIETMANHLGPVQQTEWFRPRLAGWLAGFLVYGAVPFTILLLWVRYLPRHSWGLSIVYIAAVIAVVAISIWYRDREVGLLKGARGGQSILLVLSRATIFLIAATLMGWVVQSAIEGRVFRAYLVGADVSSRPSAWTSSVDPRFEQIKGAELENSNLREANAQRAFLVRANLAGSDLRKANLAGTRLNFADMRHANLNSANLWLSEIDGANLEGASLRESFMTFAHLSEANLVDADLFEVVLEAADLSKADLRGANLRGARLSMADLRNANLKRAVLNGAELTGALLMGADLTDADLTGATLSTPPEIDRSPTRPSNWAAGHAARLDGVRGLTCDQLRGARGWENAVRDEELACSEPLPPKPPAVELWTTPAGTPLPR